MRIKPARAQWKRRAKSRRIQEQVLRTPSSAASTSAASASTASASAASVSASEAADSSSEASVPSAEAESDTDSQADATEKSRKTSTAASSSTSGLPLPPSERFEANAFGTLEEHIAGHDYPAHVTKCGPCHFWKNRWQWSAQFSCLNPVSQKKETWLGCQNGFGVCLLCSVHKGRQARSKLGKGVGCLLSKRNIERHAQCAEHAASVEAWRQRLLAEAAGAQTFGFVAPAAAASASAASTPAASATAASSTAPLSAVNSTFASCAAPLPALNRTLEPTNAYRAVVATRALLETTGSFRSLDVWLGALVGEERQACESHWHCKRLVHTMACYEKEVTLRLLRDGAVFRLMADGLERTYQVEIGTVLWSWPSYLKHLPAHGVAAGWLEELGPRGPWIVERIIGMQEFPQDMGEDGKVSMLEACVRRACLSANGELDMKLHQHVREQTRVWCSDGADLKVPMAASASFPGLAFHAWDEAHSAQRLAAHSMQDGDEITKTDQLLVTGKKPYSLAKFLSTSMVFRKTVGQAQLADEIAFVENFGWAPQRFNSRARPYARESRRWKTIFDAVATEAAGDNRDRRILARMFLVELGGENSSRLVLGGLLADLSAEHYSWVATGDKGKPDATTVQSRADVFIDRLDQLFKKSLILTLPDTYTGVTLKFLSETSYYRYGTTVQTIGIGDWKQEESARQILKTALNRVRVVVENMKECLKLYRAEHSWLNAFTAFRLPSPLSGSDEAGSTARAEAMASLRRISKKAKLPADQACNDLLRLLPRAEKHRLQGCNTREAWGRSAAEWHEFRSGRHLVELFLVWKTSSGNLERRFRRFREMACPGRAQLLDASIENCMLVEQAPPSQMLRDLIPSVAKAADAGSAVTNDYLQRILKMHETLHGKAVTRIRRAERRDTGISREGAPARLGPETDAAFGRKRQAAIAEVMSASPGKRARMVGNAPLGLSRVAREAAEESERNPAVASAFVVAKVAKLVGPAKERDLRGAAVAAKARARRDQILDQSAQERAKDRDKQKSPLKAGIMLVRLEDKAAMSVGLRLRFALTRDPLEFVAKAIKVAASTKKGHVVIAPLEDTDFALSAAFAAALLGTFSATPRDFQNPDRDHPRGIMYKQAYKNQSFHLAVSAALADKFPTLQRLLRDIAVAPGSCFKFYRSARKLCKVFKREIKTKPRLRQRIAVICKQGEREAADKKYRELYITPRSFLLKFPASARAVCPGFTAPDD